VTQNARLLVSIGIGWLASLAARAVYNDLTPFFVFLVAAAVAFAVLRPLVRPEPERAPASAAARGVAIGAALALGSGLVLVLVKQPEAGIFAALMGLVLAGVAVVMSRRAPVS
jgi:hypothetical protein